MKTLNLCIPTIMSISNPITHIRLHSSVNLLTLPPALILFCQFAFWQTSTLFYVHPSFAAHFCCLLPTSSFFSYLRQPAVLVSDTSHSRCLGLRFSSPPAAPLLPCSQPEWGTMTSSERACSAWSTISIFTESWDDRFHSVPGRTTGFNVYNNQLSL